MKREKIVLFAVDYVKGASGIVDTVLTKSMDLYGSILQGESDIEERKQGTVAKRKYTIYIKGTSPSTDVKGGNAVLIRGVSCMIADVIDYPGKLVQISAKER